MEREGKAEREGTRDVLMARGRRVVVADRWMRRVGVVEGEVEEREEKVVVVEGGGVGVVGERWVVEGEGREDWRGEE